MFVSCVVAGCLVLTVVTASAAVEKDVSPVPANADAKITPSGLLLFRFKREPQLNRAMTFTGFMPGGGMTAFSAAGGDPYRPTWYSKPAGPSDTLSPPGESSDQPAEEEPNWGKKSNKKKPYRPSKYYPSSQDEDEEEYEPPRGRGGSATASFNAWFPIMFGSFPGSGGNGGSGGNSNGAPFDRQAGSDSSKPAQDSYAPYRRSSDFPGQTVIANSVSNGRGGVASSHAVAYGNRPEGRNYGGSDEAQVPKAQQSYY